MERKEDTTNILLERIRNELVSIIEEGSDNCERIPSREKVATVKPLEDVNLSEFRSTNITDQDISSRCGVLDTKNISSIDDDIQKMQYNLEESCKMFHAIGERFENINFGCLKNRIRDLNLNEHSADPIMTIVNDLKHSFDEKYMENRINDLTKEVSSKFRNHPGEFGDIPEIGEFFRACNKLEQGLQKLRKQRDDCVNLQKRMTRVTEASYDRINDIQQKIIRNGGQNSQENI